MTPSDIATLMAPLALDSAWVYLGGSGARQQVFLLQNNLRVMFQFHAGERLVAYGAYQCEEVWEKDQADMLISSPPGVDVPLIICP